jgi:hypothetical protein
MNQHEPTIATILRLLAGEYDGPVEERRVLERVLERRPSSAKNPYATIRERLRWDGLTLGWLRLNRSQLVPLRIALQGLRFRCVPRPRDIAAGLLPLAHLQPFAGLRNYECTLRDHTGATLPFVDLDADRGREAALPAFELRSWYARTGFEPGDSIVATVATAEPLALQIEREPRGEFRAAAVAAQDAELVETIVERVRRSQAALIPCDEVVLPIFATAPWRNAYPGSPWQHLVLRDGRLQLVDDIFLTSQRLGSLNLFGSDEVFVPGPRAERDHLASDGALLAEIEALQQEMGQSRQRDADAGLWSGQIQRASAAFSLDERGPGRHPMLDGLDSELSEGGWEVADEWDPDGLFAEDDDDNTVDIDDPETIDAARQRALSLLPPDEVARYHAARPEEAELILARNLNALLVQAPDLFPRIELVPPPEEQERALDSLFSGDWQEAYDDDSGDDLDDELESDEAMDAYAASGDLISQFHDYLLEIGKTASTARVRTRALNVYADFLASYYARTLADGDYATLDECLFFYYPRRVLNTSPRQVREICTALKQFYAFLQQRGVITEDRFAQALWRRRDQAARVVEIYERISSDSPSFELLFERLFLPYTE